MRLIEVLVLQALTQQAQGELDQAMENLAKALTLAEPERFIRTFVDEGPPIARLIYEALSQGVIVNYVQRLLTAFPAIESEQTTLHKGQVSDDKWIEPLSERELDILKLVAEGLTNQEIASKLYLSLNTIKAHTRSVYSKLNVNSRTQAIARAISLGLLISI